MQDGQNVPRLLSSPPRGVNANAERRTLKGSGQGAKHESHVRNTCDRLYDTSVETKTNPIKIKLQVQVKVFLQKRKMRAK